METNAGGATVGGLVRFSKAFLARFLDGLDSHSCRSASPSTAASARPGGRPR